MQVPVGATIATVEQGSGESMPSGVQTTTSHSISNSSTDPQFSLARLVINKTDSIHTKPSPSDVPSPNASQSFISNPDLSCSSQTYATSQIISPSAILPISPTSPDDLAGYQNSRKTIIFSIDNNEPDYSDYTENDTDFKAMAKKRDRSRQKRSHSNPESHIPPFKSIDSDMNLPASTGDIDFPVSTKFTGSKPQPTKEIRKCSYCDTTSTPMWRHGPGDYQNLCNSCGVKWRRGKILADGTNRHHLCGGPVSFKKKTPRSDFFIPPPSPSSSVSHNTPRSSNGSKAGSLHISGQKRKVDSDWEWDLPRTRKAKRTARMIFGCSDEEETIREISVASESLLSISSSTQSTPKNTLNSFPSKKKVDIKLDSFSYDGSSFVLDPVPEETENLSSSIETIESTPEDIQKVEPIDIESEFDEIETAWKQVSDSHELNHIPLISNSIPLGSNSPDLTKNFAIEKEIIESENAQNELPSLAISRLDTSRQPSDELREKTDHFSRLIMSLPAPKTDAFLSILASQFEGPMKEAYIAGQEVEMSVMEITEQMWTDLERCVSG